MGHFQSQTVKNYQRLRLGPKTYGQKWSHNPKTTKIYEAFAEIHVLLKPGRGETWQDQWYRKYRRLIGGLL